MDELKPYRGVDAESGVIREGYYYHGVLTDSPLCIGDCRKVHVIIVDGMFYHVKPETVELVRENQIRQEEREEIIRMGDRMIRNAIKPECQLDFFIEAIRKRGEGND